MIGLFKPIKIINPGAFKVILSVYLKSAKKIFKYLFLTNTYSFLKKIGQVLYNKSFNTWPIHLWLGC
jgi:hypothetical protein